MAPPRQRPHRGSQGQPQWVCAKSHGGCGWHHHRFILTCPWCTPDSGAPKPKERLNQNKHLAAAGAAADDRRAAHKKAARDARSTDEREPSMSAFEDVFEDASDNDDDADQFPEAPWATVGRRRKVTI